MSLEKCDPLRLHWLAGVTRQKRSPYVFGLPLQMHAQLGSNVPAPHMRLDHASCMSQWREEIPTHRGSKNSEEHGAILSASISRFFRFWDSQTLDTTEFDISNC